MAVGTASADLERAVRARAAKIMPAAERRLTAALDAAEPPRRSGHLEQSRRIRRSFGGTVLSITVSYDAPQAGYTDKGTRPHVIVPRRAKALRFRVGGTVVYARRVNHPGSKGTRWFQKVVLPSSWRRILKDAMS